MGKKLPDELVEVLDLVGVQWPNIDEDEVRDTAKDYRNLAEDIRDVVAEGDKSLFAHGRRPKQGQDGRRTGPQETENC
ncbi:hypothetical protein KYY02_23800 [Streptomyces pimonensis]|uniref:Uncharacterized protein n=1 Tax=Streptomyces pimonensis TaxID=2860288 RepID=A0ABV4J6G9_9ACTN